MSKYTTEVRYICEHEAGLTESVGYDDIDRVLALSVGKIFDFDYPIFDEAYRNVLNIKILRHFYTREIGFETVGLWKHYLRTKMTEIMPYYNNLYRAQLELAELSPFRDVDLYREHNLSGTNTNTGDITDNGSADSTTRNENDRITDTTTERDYDRWDKYSDTPQGGLNGVANDNYLTNVTRLVDNDDTHVDGHIQDNGTQRYESSNYNKKTLNTNLDTSEQYFEHLYGKTAGFTYAKMYEDWKKAFINIDVLIINELNDLFMGLW